MRRSPAVCMLSSRLSIFILCLVILSSLSFAASADRISGAILPGQTVRLPQGLPRQARQASDEGLVDSSLRMNYITLLTVPSAAQKKELDELYLNQQNPRSASYHKWLTPEQYGARFGLSDNDLNKISAWLQSQGFSIVRTARGHDFVVFSGTAAQVERAFQTEIHNFKLDGQTYFANTTPPVIPAALSGIVTGFHGLNNFRPKSQAKRGNPAYTYVNSGDNYFIAPGDISAMYDVSTLQGLDGTGQSLAVMGETGVYQTDLTNFRQNFGLSAISCTTSSDIITACNTANFKYILVNGSATNISDGDLPEADLDLEWSGATAPKAQVIFVNSTDPTGFGVWDSWYYAVDNTVAPVITMSYTSPCETAEAYDGTSGEGTFSSDEAELLQANLEGITFLNSSGDTGAAECDFGNNLAVFGYATAYPASSQYVTGVGGTSIPAISPNEYSSTYWNASNGTEGASAKGYIPEQPWNDSQELGLLCTPANPCNVEGSTVTSWATAQTALGISAGGGGVSNCVTIDVNGVCQTGFARPSWQSGISEATINPSGFGVTSTPSRYSPDVSLLASPNFPGYLVCTNSAVLGGSGSSSTCDSPTTGITDMLNACFAGTEPCSIFGGTSVSTPVFAGMVTLLNQYLAASGGLGNINSTLYTLAAANSTNHAFNPVTTPSTGSYSNGAWCQEGSPTSGVSGDPWPVALQCPSTGADAGFLGFNAYNADPTTGYNLVTGLGSVDADNLAVAWKASLQTGFTLAALPTSVSISQGGAAGTSTITVTDLNGFTGAVTLAASNVPTGVTATFGTNPTTSTSVLSLTATGSAAVGTTVITITGTSGSTTATTTVSLTVAAGPSFTLSANPTAVTITPTLPGNTSTITVTDVGGFTGSVHLAASGLPTGVSAAFATNPTTSTSVLTLTAGGTAVAGTSTVTVTGTSGSLTATTTVSLTVTAAPNFTLSANPSSLTITPTLAGKTSTITVIPSNGFTAGVTLIASGLPTGVSAVFVPSTTTTTSTLTLTAGASASAGTATVTITGTSGSLTPETTTIALTVTPAPNFTLTDSPSTLTITPGAAGATSTITVVPSNGFTGSVTLVATGLPTGVTAAFGTNPATSTSVLTLTAGASATAGPATVTITGTSGSLPAETTTIALTVNQNFSFTTQPSTPAPALAGETTTSTFVVTASSGATFTSPVTFACNGLPATVTCAFSAVGAGAASPQTVTLTIATVGPNTAGAVRNERRRADNRSPWLPLSLPLAGIVMAGFAGRKVSKYGMIVALCATLLLIGLLVACGSSSAPAVGVSVSPSASTLFPNDTTDNWPPQTATFTATVTNSSNTAVNWAVTPSTAGTITAGGVYTAPTIAVGLPTSATITATSQADTTKSATATVTITPSTVPGSYPITVTATEGTVTHTTASFTLTAQ